jgi:hypothetical protein
MKGRGTLRDKFNIRKGEFTARHNLTCWIDDVPGPCSEVTPYTFAEHMR